MTSLLPEMPEIFELGQNDTDAVTKSFPILPECNTVLGDSWPVLSALGMTPERLSNIRFELTRAMSLEYLHMTTPAVSQIINEEHDQYSADSWIRELVNCRQTEPVHSAKIVDIYHEANSIKGSGPVRSIRLWISY